MDRQDVALPDAEAAYELVPLDELLDDHGPETRVIVVVQQLLGRPADEDVLPAAAVRVLENARKPDVPQYCVPVEREHQVAETLLVADPRDVLLVRQHDGLGARDPEPGRERRAEELVVSAPHERVVDDRHPLEHGVLQVRPVERDLVRDTVDDDGVGARRIHTLGAELGVLGDHAAIATVHFLDKLWRERPLPTDDETHCRVHGAETARRRHG